MLLALDLFLAQPQEVVIMGPEKDEATRALQKTVDRAFLPHTVLIHGESGAGLSAVEGKVLVDGKPAAYVCSNFTCTAPVTSPQALGEALRR